MPQEGRLEEGEAPEAGPWDAEPRELEAREAQPWGAAVREVEPSPAPEEAGPAAPPVRLSGPEAVAPSADRAGPVVMVGSSTAAPDAGSAGDPAAYEAPAVHDPAAYAVPAADDPAAYEAPAGHDPAVNAAPAGHDPAVNAAPAGHDPAVNAAPAADDPAVSEEVSGAVPGPQPPAGDAESAGDGVFKVRLANFEGPFDLLLQLISRHKLDVTEVALSKVTDEFMAHIRAMGPDWDLDETTEFLVVAATLLDLKAARLLPAAEVEDEGDLALLEARDLLFARLLQYRAYKQIADIFSGRLDDEARRHPRTVGLEAHHAELLPDVVISIGAEGFAKLAVKAMQPRPKPQVYVDHIHAPLVSVQEQAQIVVARLRELGEAGFRVLVADTDDILTVVARFLALLELYREKAVALEQETALGELLVRWTGGDGDETPTVTDEFDRPPEPPKEEKQA